MRLVPGVTGALVGQCTVFIAPNGNKFIACDPLGHPGAAATTRGRSGALQIENLRHLGSLIKTGASCSLALDDGDGPQFDRLVGDPRHVASVDYLRDILV